MVSRICFFFLSFISPPLVVAYFTNKIALRLSSLIIYCIGIYCFFRVSVAIGVAIYLLLILHALYNVIFKDILVNSKHLLKDTPFGIFAITASLASISFISISYTTVNNESDIYVNSEAYLNGKKLFLSCTACHSMSEENFVGPHLVGIYGREVGSVEGYDYSTSMREANLRWTDDNLKRFLTNQNSVVPGTRMIISPLNNKEINDIVEFMKRH